MMETHGRNLPSQSQAGQTIAEQFRAFRSDPRHADLRLVDMRRSGSLEAGIGMGPVSEHPLTLPSNFPIELERLEGPIRGREIPAHTGPTGFHYFLDGAQKTLPVDRAGLVPVVAAIAAAGILERDDFGAARLLPGSLREQKTWIFPQRTSSLELEHWQDWLEEIGEETRDPLVECDDPATYDALAGHYGRLIELAQRMSGKIREQIEKDLLMFWRDHVSPDREDGWIVVDGRLREDVPHAVGLVKSLQTQHLGGDEAIALFELPQGYRTTAFRYIARDRSTGTSDDANNGEEPSHNRTMWYQRFWDANGLDARHALVRVEAPHDVESSDEIDQIAAWLMTERLPRPTTDPRWPTLLYPIHFLEEILKRRIAAMTAGWPS